MMFGTRTEHRVDRCGSCGSLILLDPPPDPASAYPDGYYAHGSTPSFVAPDNLKRRLLRARSRALLRLPPAASDRLLARAPYPLAPFRWLAGLGLGTSARILDVGCGEGYLLRRLALAGFTRLNGVDPYMAEESESEVLTLRRGELRDVTGPFEVVMLHHVLEHLTDPVEALREARELLAPGGAVIARVPLADSWAARHYGADWVQLDAPRHLSVPTEAAARDAAAAAGLRVRRAWRDSDAIQFWGSEQYRLGIPLEDPRSVMRGGHPFAAGQLRGWAARARALNRAGEGDSGCFVLAAA
jgi:SAM-dependent methyltransferase